MNRVVIVGAGPAGASLAYLLAHRGIEVILLERRRSFDREFRGEVLMPSGIEAFEQMGLTEVLAKVPAHTQQDISMYLNGRLVLRETLAPDDFQGRRPRAVSQPALLEAIVQEAEKSPHFSFERGVSVKALLRDGDVICGVRVRDDDGERSLHADLVIGADGRNSAVRKQLNLPARQMSPPMDIVWCKIPCPDEWAGMRGYAGRGHLLVAYHTWDDTLQLGWVILKGTFGELRSRGINGWIEEMSNHVSPDFAEHLRAHQDATQKPFLLESVSDRVHHWSAPGALVIGDAAHTMSPVAGQGINIALRDAIVAANHLVPVLATAAVNQTSLANALTAIEKERLPEVEKIQDMQAQPPKVILTRAWWGEPVRRLAGVALGNQRIRQRAATRFAAFPYGVTQVHMTV
ncbi:MAG: FAD-dependent oxidoreductase [Gammaproteobacteria bacterium]|nr:MAG: FAD-dependent oxidoreductase [Gammaproteobacteria bacterium]